MQDKKKSKPELIKEINELRGQVAAMKAGVREREEFKLVLGRDALALDSLAEIIVYEDTEGRILWANKAAMDTFGLTLEEMKGKTCYELWQMPGEPPCSGPVKEAVRSGRAAFAEVRVPEGKYWNVRAYPIKEESGSVIGAIEVALDITGQKQAQDELVKSEQQCRLIIEEASDAIFQLDTAGHITDANRAACDSLGRTRDELLTMSVSQVDLDWQAERVSGLLEGLAVGAVETVEGTNLRKNGTTFPVEVRLTKIETDGSPVILAFVRDITQRRRIESALMESEQALKAELESETRATDSIRVSGIDIKWRLREGTCTFDKLPVAMMWIESTLAGLISGGRSMVGTKRFALALQSQGRKSVEDDWQVISQFADFQTGFKAIANIARVAGWGDWHLMSVDMEKKECRFRVYNSWEGRCQKALGVSWGSGLVAGKLAGYTSMLFKTNCWADQTAFCAAGDDYDEFLVHPSDRSIEQEIENLFASDQATRADMAVALEKLRKEIEERIAAEKLLRESEERYRNFVANSSEGIYRVDLIEPVPLDLPEEEIAELISKNAVGGEVNEALANMYGVTPEQMIGRHVTDLTPDYGKRVIGIVRSKSHQVSALETVDYDKNGKPVYLSESFFGVVKDGMLHRIWGVQQSITERKRAEERLRRSEEEHRQIVEKMGEGLVTTDADYVFTYVNPALAKMLGRTYEEMVGHHISEFVHPDHRDLISEQIELRKKGVSKPYDLTWITKDGRKVYTITSPQGIFDSQGNFIGSFGVVTDITEHKRTERELRRSREMLQKVLDTIPARVFWKDRNSVYMGCNKLFAHDAGVESPAEVSGKTDYDMPWTKEESDLYIEYDRHVMESDTPEYHILERQLQADGKHAWVDTSKVPIHDEYGNVVGILGTYEDITERKGFEEERERLLKALAAKNEELESIVYVSSHDLRSPLVNIQGFSGELHRSCDQLAAVTQKTKVNVRDKTELSRILEEEIPTSLGYISNSTTKIDALLRGLLKLSRLGSITLNVRRLNMNSILREVVRGMQYQIRQSDARVSIGVLPPCTADPAQVGQVFANLLDNALKYRDSERSPRIKVEGVAENSVCVYSVKDNGIGIAPAHMDKIFEIFHRLDPHSEVAGEGLGLTVARRILDLMNGSLRVESEPGKGSTFYVTLPAAKEEE